MPLNEDDLTENMYNLIQKQNDLTPTKDDPTQKNKDYLTKENINKALKRIIIEFDISRI